MTTLTNEEARKQECPIMTYCINEQGVIQDREQPFYVQARCKGSDCKMAWRWEYGYRKGYCGIAGKP